MSLIRKITIGLILTVMLAGGILTACQEKPTETKPIETKNVVFGDWGVGPTCLAPFYVALEDGFFAREGLEVEHVRYPGMKEVYEALSLGRVDFSPVPTHLVNLLEEGFNIKVTLAIHPGCMQGIADVNQPIYEVKDLKGKTIGIPGFGTCPHAFTSWELMKAGLDPDKDVEFKAYAPPDLLAALKSGKIDAMLVLDPIGQLAINEGAGRLIFSTTYPEHGYSDVYCCLLSLNADLVESEPGTAAAITRAIVEAGKSITGRESEVAQMMIDKQYSVGDPEVHSFLLQQYDFANPSVQGIEDTLRYYGALYQYVGIIRPETDMDTLIANSVRRVIAEVGDSRVPPPPTLP